MFLNTAATAWGLICSVCDLKKIYAQKFLMSSETVFIIKPTDDLIINRWKFPTGCTAFNKGNLVLPQKYYFKWHEILESC